jgi:hypothetical protein
MGVWFLGTALGNKLAGVVAGEFNAKSPASFARWGSIKPETQTEMECGRGERRRRDPAHPGAQVTRGKVYYPSRQVRLRAERLAARHGRTCVNPS